MERITQHFRANRRALIAVGVAFLLGVFWIIALRFVTLKTDAVHYHANFAVFIDDERLPLDAPLLYEEVQACGGEDAFNPKIRVHMHNQDNHVVHVHDKGATWGHFFANLGMTLGDTVVKLDSKVYQDTDETPISYMLNGEMVPTIANRTIKSEDRLLISVGATDTAVLKSQYDQIETDAGKFNQQYDPSGCSGGKDFTFTERLKKAVGVFGE